MSRTAVLSFLLFLPSVTLAAPPEKFYFIGEAKLSLADGKPFQSQVILLEKTHDRDQSQIVERALVVKPDGKVDDETMILQVSDDNSFTLTDAKKTIHGKGELFGPMWKWTYFKGTFKHDTGIVIEDENFMTDDSVITARKRITGPGGRTLMIMEMSLKGVTPATFEILAKSLTR